MLNHFLLSLLAAVALLQAPVRPSEDGTITGIVKATDGRPAVGVRVTARPKPDSLDELQEGVAMSSIAQTDQDGRYRLENVPPGRYYVAAGNIDLPTYYPGTLDVASGTVVQITPGTQRAGIDFTLADLSFSLAGTSGLRPGYTIPIQTQVEGGGKVPVFSPAGAALLDATPPGATSGTAVWLGSGFITLPFPVTPADYEVRVRNVPEGYRLKSLTYGTTNLLAGPLQLSAAAIPLNSGPVPASNTPQSAGGPSTASSSTVFILLTRLPTTPTAGVRIAGQTAPGARSIWLGDTPGFLFADGSFELRGVPPGPHVILASNENGTAMQPSGASVMVGDQDMEGIQLDPIPLLPKEVSPAPPASHAPGTRIPLATLKGRLVSAVTQQPVRGTVNIVGSTTMVAYPVDQEGRFEVPKLLPGSYNLTASIFDYYTVNETVVIGEEDSTVELRARPAF